MWGELCGNAPYIYVIVTSGGEVMYADLLRSGGVFETHAGSAARRHSTEKGSSRLQMRPMRRKFCRRFRVLGSNPARGIANPNGNYFPSAEQAHKIGLRTKTPKFGREDLILPTLRELLRDKPFWRHEVHLRSLSNVVIYKI